MAAEPKPSGSEPEYPFEVWCQEAHNLFKHKNRVYGRAFEDMGLLGAISEMRGITKRLKIGTFNAMEDPTLAIPPSKIRDLLLDLHNYAVMALMMLEQGNLLGNDED